MRMTMVYARIANRTVADEYFAVAEKVEALYNQPNNCQPTPRAARWHVSAVRCTGGCSAMATLRRHSSRSTAAPKQLARQPELAGAIWRLNTDVSPRGGGANRAAVAVAHSILVIAYHVLTKGSVYEDLGGNYFDDRDKTATVNRAVARIKRLGYEVTVNTPRRVSFFRLDKAKNRK